MTGLARPAVAPPAPWSFPTGSTTALPGEVTLLTYHLPGQYVVSVRVGLPVSPAAEPRQLEGVATIMARTLDEGTARHSAEEFARLLERKGVSFGAGIGESGLTMDLEVVKGNLAAALDLLRQIITEPVFPEAEVARQVRARLAEIDQERAVAANRGVLEFVRTFYADDDRASRPVGGTRETVTAITREAVVAFHTEHVVSSGATIVVSGDLSGLDVPALVGAALGGWHPGRGQGPFVRRTAVLAQDRCRIVVVDRPDSVQSEIVVGAPGPDRSVAGGWAPYPVIGFVLGGSPTARIDAVLREEKGYTYGIRSSFRPRRSGGLFLTAGSVRGDVTAESLGVLVGLLESGCRGFSDTEVRSGVDFIGKTAPGRFATADDVADEAIMMALDGRTTQFTTDNLRDLATVDAARVDRAFDRFARAAGVDPDRPGGGWTIVVVGDATAHLAGIESLGLGPVTVVHDH
ncbi:pitrilysin family protein [Intrasporangium sp.]|uniref:M16 family metallopeptidase n=1 Tax=Intrasporangium sp. TaxID=1925024 RepID=UPI00322161F9